MQAGASFVQFDRSLDEGEDLDLDGRSEALHVRSVVFVQEPESVTVPAGTFAHSIKMRTETTFTVTLSRDGTEIPISGVQTQWLAPGVGPVKSVSSMAGPEGLATSESEELTGATLVDHLLAPAVKFPAGGRGGRRRRKARPGDGGSGLNADGRQDLAVANYGGPTSPSCRATATARSASDRVRPPG